MKRAVQALSALGLLLLVAGTPAQAICIDEPDINCGRQCSWYAGGWYCWDPSNPERACISYSPGACGEDSNYPCCTGGTGGF